MPLHRYTQIQTSNRQALECAMIEREFSRYVKRAFVSFLSRAYSTKDDDNDTNIRKNCTELGYVFANKENEKQKFPVFFFFLDYICCLRDSS